MTEGQFPVLNWVVPASSSKVSYANHDKHEIRPCTACRFFLDAVDLKANALYSMGKISGKGHSSRTSVYRVKGPRQEMTLDTTQKHPACT